MSISQMISYRILLRKEPEGGYTVTVPSLPGCVTYGESIEEATEMAKEAIELYLESLKAHNEEIPTDHKKDLPKGTLMEILKQAGISKEELK
jgi:predicted RNase H-like HicB family nuclease